MTFENWLLFCVTEAVLSFTPGPAVLLVISMSLSRGARAGLAASLGSLSINAVYFALSATSIGAILLASQELFLVVKWLGAGYLIWLGLQMFFSSSRGAAADEDAISPIPRSSGRAYSLALMTQGVNPKALLFFGSILPQFIDPAGPVGWQIMILGASSIVLEFCILAIYVATCRTARSWARHPKFAVPLRRVGGALLIAAGARLAAIRQG